ncbi:MAG: RraA family protein [Bacteroidia bacterium]
MNQDMNNLYNRIIQTIRKNRISTVEVADALGKKGVIDGISPVCTGKFVVGRVQYIYGHSESNWPIHEQGEKLREGGILFVDTFNCNNKAAFGDIVSKYFILYKEMEGLVVNGLMRDAHTLRKEGYPVWCTGITPLGCTNKPVVLTPEIEEAVAKRRELFEDSIMIADDSGCTMIEKKEINEELLNKLEFIELQEDIWYYCIDSLKWSTYKTICEKAYLTDRDVLPEVMQEKLRKFDI